MPAIHILIKGKVQGVFYRASARDTAGQLGLSGWVKNTREGHVEILAAGEEEVLQQFIAWCKKGPPEAVVSEVIVGPADDTGFTGFSIVR